MAREIFQQPINPPSYSSIVLELKWGRLARKRLCDDGTLRPPAHPLLKSRLREREGGREGDRGNRGVGDVVANVGATSLADVMAQTSLGGPNF